MLFGFVFLSHQIGAFLGVWLGGVVYERTGGVRCDVVAVDRTRPGRGSGPSPDPGAAGAAVGAEHRMKLRTHILIVLVLGVLTFGAAAFQAAAASGDSSPSSTFRLVCPLH